MPKKTFLLVFTALAYLFAQAAASAAEKKPRRVIKNNPTIYSTSPVLPADVPYTNQRNRNWLGGYLGGEDYNDGNFDDEDNIITSPRHERRDWRERRRWRRD